MLWIKKSVMSQRLKLVEQMLLLRAKVSELCEHFGVSRKTAYKFLSRYRHEGMEAMTMDGRWYVEVALSMVCKMR